MRKRQERSTLRTESGWDKKIRAFLADVGKLLFPPRCPVCDRILTVRELRKGQLIHGDCRQRLYPVVQPLCCHCGRPLPDAAAEYCYDCGRHILSTCDPYWKKDKPASWFLQGRALYLYQGAVKNTMYRFKYANRREYAAFFAGQAAECLLSWMKSCKVEAAVPVPVYRKKQKKRGYNQAGILAEKIAEILGISYEPEALIRVRDTTPQKALDHKERKNNLKSAFQAADFVVKYNCILLVDDIYTTGATAEAAAKALRASGVKEVYVFTVCIGMGDTDCQKGALK